MSPPNASLEPDGDLDVLGTAEAGPRAIRGAALRTGSYMTSTLLTAASAPLLTRHLGVVGFGEYYAVGSVVTLVAGLTEGGFGTIGMREYAGLSGPSRRRFMSNLLGMRLAFVSFGLLCGLVFAAGAYPSLLVAGTAIASVGILITVAQMTLAVPLFTELVVGRRVLCEMLSQVATVALIVLGVVLGAGLLIFLLIPIPTGLMLLALTARMAGSKAPRKPTVDLGQWWLIIRETYPIAASTAVQTLYMRSVVLVMTLIASPAIWGVYAYSVRVLEILLGVPVLLVSSVFPVMTRAVRDDARRMAYILTRTLQAGIVTGLGIALVTFIGARVAMNVLTTAGHASQATTVLRVQSVDLLLAFFSAAWGAQLIALRRHRTLLASSAVAMILTAGLTAALVPVHGALGGGVASVAGECGLVLTMGISLRRSGDLHFALGRVPHAVACAAVAVAAAQLAPVTGLVRVGIFVILYGAGLAVSGAVPVEIREAVRGRLREIRG